MTITIIGDSGFIGSRLCQRLQNAGIDFTIIDKNPSHFFPDKVSIADIRDFDALYNAPKPCDAVINLAAEHRDDASPRSLYDEVNVKGSENIVKVCSQKSIQHIIFTSSVAVYGFAPPNTPVSLKDGLMRTIQFEFLSKKDPNEVLFYSE